MTNIQPQEFQLFRTFIQQQSGISLDDDKAYLLESRLQGLLIANQCETFGDLYRKACNGSQAPLVTRIIDAVTTNETLWFRDKAPYSVINDVFLPEMAEQVARGKPKVRIWSAACSTGQEPYSIAISIAEYCHWHGNGVINPSHFEILATDISTDALNVGKLGAYDGLSMSRGMTDSVKNKYFRQNGRFWLIDPDLKKSIEFRLFNLLGDFGQLGVFDMILCRNVAIYFSQSTKLELFDKLNKSLRPDGIFLLGTSESLGYYGTKFKSSEHNNHTFYRA